MRSPGSRRVVKCEPLEGRKLCSFGEPDTSWGTAARIITEVGSNATVQSLTVSGSKIYAVGHAIGVASAIVLARYNGDGSLDSSFGSAGKATTISAKVAVQQIVNDSGAIYILAQQTGSKTRILKFNPDGSFDANFGASGVASVTADPNFIPTSIAYAGGKLLIAGSLKTSPQNFISKIFRLNGNGSIDSGFGDGGAVQLQLGLSSKHEPKVVDRIASITSTLDGHIVVAGGSAQWNPEENVSEVGKMYLLAARFRSSGRWDDTFGAQGVARTQIAAGSLVDPSVDQSLQGAYPALTHYVAHIQGDGSSVIFGRGLKLSAASFLSDGSLSFNSSADAGFPLDQPSGIAALSDGRFVLSGVPTKENRSHGPALAYVTPTGTFGTYALTDDLKANTIELVDDQQQSATVGVDPYSRPHPIAVSPDGELLVGGAPQVGTGLEIEKFKVGSLSDQRADVFANGTINDLVRGPSGTVHLAYYDQSNHVLKYARRLVNGQWSSPTTVDASPFSGDFLSIAFDSNNNPSIAYHDGFNGDLKYAKSSDGGNTWSKQTVDSSGSTGLYPSLLIDAFDGSAIGNNQAMIAYYRKTSGDLRFATQNSNGSWTISTVASAGDVGRSARLVRNIFLSGQAKPVIGYVDSSNSQVNFAEWAAGSWSSQVVATLNGAADYLFIAYGRYAPAISFYDAYNGDLKVAHKTGTTQWTVQTTASKGAVGLYSAATFFSPIDVTVHVQTYAYDKTTNSAALYLNSEGGTPVAVAMISNGGKYLTVARGATDQVASADAAFIDSGLGALRVGTVFTPFDDSAQNVG